MSSKPIVNAIQIQILGLLIYYFAQIRRYKFIFMGDFNSYVTVNQDDLYDPEKDLSLFSFLKHMKDILKPE